MLKNLSMYGWISCLIISILLAIFMGISSNGTSFFQIVTNTVDLNGDDDDNNQGTNDVCYSEGFVWPSKVWSLSLSNGLCFSGDQPANSAIALASPFAGANTFGSIFGSDAFSNNDGFECLPWGGKTKGSVESLDMYSNTGYLSQLCNAAADFTFFDDIDKKTFQCSNFEKYSTSFQSAAKAAKAGIAFSVFAAILSVAGLIFQGKEGSTKTTIQGLTGAFLIIVLIMTIVTIHLSKNDGNNPYLSVNNNLAFGCFSGYVLDNFQVAVLPSSGFIVTIVALILSLTMGCLCLTITQCFNPCCCPCCFKVDSPIATLQVPFQGNGDNSGGSGGVKV